jgi:preprotein translocase subunit SecG
MTTVLLMIHLFVTIALIGVVLIQRSEGGGLGIGTSQGMGAFMSGRGTANLLTRTTAILAAIFFGLSLALALINKGTGGVGRSILDVAPASAPAPAGGTLPPLAPAGSTQAPATKSPAATGTAPAAPASSVPAEPAPSAPPAPAKPAAPSVPTN